MIRHGRRLPLASVLALALGACTQTNSSIPSLSRRPIEGIDKAEADAPAPVAAPASAAGTARLQAIDTRIRTADAAFHAAAETARPRIAAAGPAGSESWVAAQEALSAVTAAQADLATAVNDLDQLSRDLVVSADPSAGADLTAAAALTAQAVDIQGAQAKAVAALGSPLAAP